MHKTVIAVVFMALAVSLIAQEVKPDYNKIRAAFVGQSFEEFSIKDKTYSGATVTKWEPDGITIAHKDGIAKVKIEDMPEEAIKLLGMSQREADLYREEVRKKKAAAISEMGKEVLPIPTPIKEPVTIERAVKDVAVKAELIEQIKILKKEIKDLYREQEEENKKKRSSSASAHAKQKEVELKALEQQLEELE
jgi:hypothetical protein